MELVQIYLKNLIELQLLPIFSIFPSLIRIQVGSTAPPACLVFLHEILTLILVLVVFLIFIVQYTLIFFAEIYIY